MDQTTQTEDIKKEEVVEETVTVEETSADAAESAQEETVEAASDAVETKAEEVAEEKEESEDASANSAEEAAPEEVKTEEPKAADHPDAKWYIIHTYAGHENKVARSLKQRMEAMGFADRIFDIVVPTKDTIKVSQGKKETVKEKIFPGYVLVKMVLDDESWFLVRSTQGVTSFIGAGSKPTPISEEEVKAIQKFMSQSTPTFQTNFTVGEAVKITDGPFNDFLGTIDSIDDARGKVHVLVSIFGRETPVELDFLQVKKI